MFFDIGANIGNWSLENINNCEKIIAVEASPTTFIKLFENTKYENKIDCLNYAICNSSEEFIDFCNCSGDTLSTINKEWLDSEKSRFYNQFSYDVIKCKTNTLDKLIQQYGVPDLIKIDVEGGELECLKSLTQRVNIICFEWASETNDITFNCIDYLYRPDKYKNVSEVKEELSKTTPKNEWGMIWAR